MVVDGFLKTWGTSNFPKVWEMQGTSTKVPCWVLRCSKLLFVGVLLSVHSTLLAQITLLGTVSDTMGAPMFGVTVHLDGRTESLITDEKGKYAFKILRPGPKKVIFFMPGYGKEEREIDPKNGTHTIDVTLRALRVEMQGVTVAAQRQDDQNLMTRLMPVQGAAIYAGRKTEVVNLSKSNANLSTNRARQAFSHVAGLNIWESDCGGLQIGVGGRGLSPSRNESFNTRQNGYDIAADALGYPESYYSPPMQAIDRVEIVRGAASLQYGPQFGGLVNFVMKRGNDTLPLAVEMAQTVGSYGFYNAFLSAGGQVKGFNHYTFAQYRRGDCWRCNSTFNQYTVGTRLEYRWAKTTLRAEYTRMGYLAQQAGGLTDAQFATDPRQSLRDRNWFKVDWNLAAVSFEYRINNRTLIDLRTFGLVANRAALGFLGPPSLNDPVSNPNAPEYAKFRNLTSGEFTNLGAEARVLHRYNIGQLPMVFLTGIRAYAGRTVNRQGVGNANSGPNFTLLDRDDVDRSVGNHPSHNVAWFAEHLFNATRWLSITPGVRVEYISTGMTGESHKLYRDLAGNILLDSVTTGADRRDRVFPLLGLGISAKPLKMMEVYANVSQNFRPINFTDLWTANPSYRIDPAMRDERGLNADLGLRGSVRNWLVFDVTGYFLLYNDRIGFIQRTDSELYSVYRLRTNVADARTFGVESLIEVDAVRAFDATSNWSLKVFSNAAYTNSRYTSGGSNSVAGNWVELSPQFIMRAGATLSYKTAYVAFQYNHTSSQFTDATNAVSTPTGVNGLIPAYNVVDLNVGYTYKRLSAQLSIDNVLDARYFTRRATGYPGPGIIPSDGRTVYFTVKIGM